ncbi:MAG TPA: undecaprenyl-diphosphate phosphatase [Longimicrobiales bacterium]|nr:undecaprenyl-diphosphate phosphatase [Longimicrobiales bacterium]
MTLWEAIVLGIVQGATEFLPVSSSGHLVMSQELLGVEVPGILFEVAVHLATLISILVVYRKRVADLVVGCLRGERDSLGYAGLLVLATIPAAVLGLFFEDAISAAFDDPAITGIAFLVTGGLLWSTRTAVARGPEARPTVRTALLMGFAQAFALIPGISRSGSTVVAGLWGGVAGREAAAFSFLMAVPAILGAALLKLPGVDSTGLPLTVLMGGAVAAALTGILAIRVFVAFLRKQAFHRFAYYLWPVGIAFLAYLAWS